MINYQTKNKLTNSPIATSTDSRSALLAPPLSVPAAGVSHPVSPLVIVVVILLLTLALVEVEADVGDVEIGPEGEMVVTVEGFEE